MLTIGVEHVREGGSLDKGGAFGRIWQIVQGGKSTGLGHWLDVGSGNYFFIKTTTTLK